MKTASPQNMNEIRLFLADLPKTDSSALQLAVDRNMQLTKPPGALGRLEDIAVWYAGWRSDPRPTLNNPQVAIFAGNHGVAARGVSAFPPEVTAQMVANFNAGGAAINQMAKTFGARLDICPLDLDRPTADFTKGPAMSEEEFIAAFAAGWSIVDENADLVVTGEMGIGNTTSAAAISTALFGGDVADWVGRGTGVDDAGLTLKQQVVSAGLTANPNRDPLTILRCLGGRELAAMAGTILRARTLRIPVILDGYICSAAAACLAQAGDGALDHALAGHVSAETAHKALLSHLEKEPLLDLHLRLGEGSGGALAIGVVKAALNCHSGMATFAEAGVAAG